jgi:hypothetical protein
MSWKEKTVVRILLMIAEMLAAEPWSKEIHHLSNHITQYRGTDAA